MDQSVVELARALAADLNDLDDGLSAKVEAEILTHGRELDEARFDAGTIIGIAGLILGAAQFAYRIHRDRKKDQQVAPDVLKRRLRIALDERHYPDTSRRDRVIEAVVKIIERER